MSPHEHSLRLQSLLDTLEDLARRQQGRMALVRVRIPTGLDPGPTLRWLSARLGGLEVQAASAPGPLGIASVDFAL